MTISKIRFLESQGLVDPERTPSGYRKFYEPDIERLRWVLRQQRDAFLPLKVIKGRLDENGEPRRRRRGRRRRLRGDRRRAARRRGRRGRARPGRGQARWRRPCPRQRRRRRAGPGLQRPSLRRHAPRRVPAALTEPLFDVGPPYSAYGAPVELSGAGRRPAPRARALAVPTWKPSARPAPGPPSPWCPWAGPPSPWRPTGATGWGRTSHSRAGRAPPIPTRRPPRDRPGPAGARPCPPAERTTGPSKSS